MTTAPINVEALLGGFAFGLTACLLLWAALVGLSIVRRLLS